MTIRMQISIWIWVYTNFLLRMRRRSFLSEDEIIFDLTGWVGARIEVILA